MGTADLYAVIEGFDEVADSLVVDTTALGSAEEGALLCFVVLADGASLDDVEPRLRAALRKELSPRHVPGPVRAGRRGAADAEREEVRGPGQADPRGRRPGEGRQPRGAAATRTALAPFLELAGRELTGAQSRSVDSREVGGRQRAQHGEGVEVGRHVAADRPARAAGRRTGG